MCKNKFRFPRLRNLICYSARPGWRSCSMQWWQRLGSPDEGSTGEEGRCAEASGRSRPVAQLLHGRPISLYSTTPPKVNFASQRQRRLKTVHHLVSWYYNYALNSSHNDNQCALLWKFVDDALVRCAMQAISKAAIAKRAAAVNSLLSRRQNGIDIAVVLDVTGSMVWPETHLFNRCYIPKYLCCLYCHKHAVQSD